MIVVAYVALLFGLGTQATRYSRLASLYQVKAANARALVDVFQLQAEKMSADLRRAENARELRAGRIPDGLLSAQKEFLKGLEGATTEAYKRYRYGLIADGEERQARLATWNLTRYRRLVAYYARLTAKYTRAARKPWEPVAPDPPPP
jgi:hypothetical protein